MPQTRPLLSLADILKPWPFHRPCSCICIRSDRQIHERRSGGLIMLQGSSRLMLISLRAGISDGCKAKEHMTCTESRASDLLVLHKDSNDLRSRQPSW